MANVKNFGLAGIGGDVQFGKSGGRLIYDSASSFFKFTTDGSALSNVRVATTPANANDAASKSYVDATKSGLDVKESCRAATTAAGTLASDYENADVIDGVTLATGDRILIKNQAAGAENGIYTVNATGAPTRATDFDGNDEVTAGAFSFIEEGTINSDSGYVLSTDGAITVGTTAITFTQFSGAGLITAGDGLAKAGNTLSVNVDGSTLEINADALRIKSDWVGQNTITTLGTIGTGTWAATDVAIAHGGTGASTDAAARTNLGVAIGSDVQAYDAQLADVAGLAVTDGGIIVGDGSNFVLESGNTARTSLGLGTGNTPTFTGIVAGGQITTVTDPTAAQHAATKAYVDAAVLGEDTLAEMNDVTLTAPADASLLLYDTGTSMWRDAALSGDATITDLGAITLTDGNSTRTNLGLAIGSDVQAYDADLTALAGLSTADSNFIVGNGSAWVAESGATVRTSLGLDSMALQGAAAVAITGGSISGITTFTTGTLGSTATFTGDGEFTGNLTVGGNLTVSGSSITLDVGTVTSEDKHIQVNSGATAQETGVAGGLEVKRSNVANANQFGFIAFDDSTDSWNFGTGAASANGTNNATMRFGTVSAGTWNGTAIGRAYGGFGASISGHSANSLVEADGGQIVVGNSGQYLRSDGTNFAASNLLVADIVGTLTVGAGGTGITAVGTANKYLRSTGAINQYDYVSGVRDSAGVLGFEISGALTNDNQIRMTNAAGNVTLQAIDPTDASADIDLVLKGQQDGLVVLSESAGGNSLVMADDNLDITVSGGAANGGNAGDAIFKGGNGTGAHNSGDSIIKGGTGGASEGKVKILDSSDNEIALFERTASAVNEFSFTNAATGSGPTLSTTGGDAHINLALSPKGNGVVTVPAGYEALTITDDTLVTKAWVNANVVTDTDDLVLRSAIGNGATTTAIGTMPNAAGITYYVSKVSIYVSTAYSGGSIDHVTLTDGTTTWVADADADVTTTGTYVIDLPFATATAGAASFTLNYLQSNASASTPTGGAGIVTVEYKAIS